MSSDVKMRTADGVFRYPDVSVVCGPRQYHGRGRSILTNPLLVVEVLSDSTEATDRGEKFHEYQAIPRLTDYCWSASARRSWNTTRAARPATGIIRR